MKKYLKLISLALALIMLISCVVSCDSAEEQTVETNVPISEGTDATDTVTVEAETEYTPAIEEKNYDSEFFLSIHPDNNPVKYHWVEESENDVMSQAIYDRQQRIYDYLGVEILGTVTETSRNYVDPFKNAVKNKDGSVDTLLSHVYHGIDGFISGNYLADFNDYSQINLSADYWDLDIMEEASINGRMYLGKSDFNILWTFVIAFNKDMMDKYGDALGESVYSMVDNYSWTLDQMISIANLVYIDEGSDGQTIDDTFGIIGCQDIAFCGFLHACNINIIEPDEKGEYILSAYSDVNKAKTTDIIEKIHNLAKSDCAWFWKYQASDTVSFVSGKVLFALSDTKGMLPSYPNYDISFGVLPYPMYDENQKDTGYRSLQWGGYICIPSYVTSPELVGDTLEMLSFFSADVNNAFYDKLLGKQASDSPDDRRMLEIVWDSLCTDFAQSYYSAILDTQILYIVPYLTYEDTTPNIASFIASKESTINKKINKFIQLVSKLQ